MQKHPRIRAITIAMMIVAGTATLMVLQGQTKAKHNKQTVAVLRRQDRSAVSPSQKEIREQLPIADAFPAENVDQKEKEKRQKRNARHDNERREPITEAPYPITVINNSHWWQSLPAIPVTESDVILIGEINDARAFLSNDRTGIYSEFTISVGEVLKNNGGFKITTGAEIDAERSGGAVRFPSGAIQKYVIANQHFPLVGRTYILFLKRDGDQEFSIVTAYELRSEQVLPLDGASNANGARLPFDVYKGSDVSSFLDIVRNAIRNNVKGVSL